MKQNTKFIWIYVAILFSFAIILILFAGLTQNNNQKEITQEKTVSAGLRSSLSSLTEQNKKIEDENKELNDENAALKESNTQLALEKEMALAAYGGDIEVTRTLIIAYTKKHEGRIDEAKQIVKTLNFYSMTQAQKQVYNKIIGE